VNPGHLKLALAVHGLRLHPSIAGRHDLLRPRFSRALPARAVDLILSDDTRVAVPVEAPSTVGSPFALVADQGRIFVVEGNDVTADGRTEVRAVPQPRFYERRTSRDTPMWRIATVEGNHVLVSLAGACGFSVRGAPCRFCVEGARSAADLDSIAPVADVVEVVRAAFDEGAAEFVYFNSGAFDAEDGGIAALEPYIEAVRKHFDTLVAVQVHPPRTDRWVDRAYAIGVDALSYNLEIFGAEALGRYCIGRQRYIGRERYLEALGYAARIFPGGTVWSELVAGLEPPASTIAGIDALCGMGVVPVVTIPHSVAEGPRIAADPEATGPILEHLYRAVKQQRINMGWVRDIAAGITPLEARWFAGDHARLAVTVQHLTRSRLGGLAARGLARFRRRMRVRPADEASDAAHT
jgi:hypothetical protein